MNQCRWWATPLEKLLKELNTSPAGLSTVEAESRECRSDQDLQKSTFFRSWRLLLSQYRSPTMLLLLVAAVISLFLSDKTDAVLILIIVIVSTFLSYLQEGAANRSLERLLKLIKSHVSVIRDGEVKLLISDKIVPGDVIQLFAGSCVPGDCRLIEAKDLHIDEATLTGESFPVEKRPGDYSDNVPFSRRVNVVFRGTHVISGTGLAVVVTTGTKTELGLISAHLRLRPPESDFEHGVRRFGYFLIEITLLFVVGIFAVNVYLQKPVLESILFALALTVGLTPQLLPMIMTINLTHGARRMAAHDVIVRRLNSIENFGSMTILCSDKTGTLTEGKIQIRQACDPFGEPSEFVGRLAYWNALYETGFSNPIDDAIRSNPPVSIPTSAKLDEVPYDFLRRRLSILIRMEGRHLLITKGAPSRILEICTTLEATNGSRQLLDSVKSDIEARIQALNSSGYRTLAIAFRDVGTTSIVTRDDESQMIFAGFLLLSDAPKEESASLVRELHELQVSLKLITGDNRYVATDVARRIGLNVDTIVSGSELHQMSDRALFQQASKVDVFAEVEPNQKERIILALRKAGHVVGYLGDGINDATALHSADVGISVDSAVDVAKEAADIVLLQRDLSIIIEGIREGRRTFANTMKYIFMATSANFGNMVSMAIASVFLPFLPLLPSQILLANLLTDSSAMTIANDRVDAEDLMTPRRWDLNLLCNFMLVFGVLSSVFDFMTFALLMYLHVDEVAFRTGWFVESVSSASLIILAVRSHRLLIHSRPVGSMVAVITTVVLASVLLPYSLLARPLGFAPVPPAFLTLVIAILVLYLISAEIAKQLFFGRQP